MTPFLTSQVSPKEKAPRRLCVLERQQKFCPLAPTGPQPRLLRPWDFPGKNTGVGCYFLLQEIFPTQGLNLDFLHCKQNLYLLSNKIVPKEW